MTRPTPADLAAAIWRGLPDVIAPGLEVLFCGINPGLWSAATGHHFARPGNRFWLALHHSGFTARRLRPDEQRNLLESGLGITNLVDRGTARASDLAARELRAGRGPLEEKIGRYGPTWLAVVGVTAYRIAFDSPSAFVGLQADRVGGTRVWVLPNPSGLNAHYPLDRLVAEFARLRAEIA
jgi:TDG/mug DNA glycosylase family protein